MKTIRKFSLLKAVLGLFFTITLLSCSDDDNDTPVVKDPAKIKSISYTPNKAEAKESKVFNGVVAKKDPTELEVTFSIKSIKKGADTFTNLTEKGFAINATSGKVSLVEGHKITKGVYKLTIEATDKTAKKNKVTTVYEVTVKKVPEHQLN